MVSSTNQLPCQCGCGQTQQVCDRFARGFRAIDPFTWGLSTKGLSLTRQQAIANAVSGCSLGYFLTPGTTVVTFEQSHKLDSADVFMHRLQPLTPNGINLAHTISDEAFWDPRVLSDKPTPNVGHLTKDDPVALINGFSRALRPVRLIDKRRDNIGMVVTHFLREFPDGHVDLLIKDRAALTRLALYRTLAHVSLFDEATVAQNLREPIGQSPFLATMAQTSALPMETLLQQRHSHGFLIDWVDHSLIFWLGPSTALPDSPAVSAVLSPWRGPAATTFDLGLTPALYRQLLTWTVGATNDLYRFLMDGGRSASQPEPADEWLYDYLTWVEINNLVHMIMQASQPFVRLELFLRLAYNIASRKGAHGAACHIQNLPFGPKSSEIKTMLFQCRMPDILRKHLWTKWQDLASTTVAQVVGRVLPAFRPQNPNKPIQISGLTLTPTNYVAHFLESLRHSTHGFDSRYTDKTILFTHTGEIPDDLPYLAFFWWIGILAKPEWLFV